MPFPTIDFVSQRSRKIAKKSVRHRSINDGEPDHIHIARNAGPLLPPRDAARALESEDSRDLFLAESTNSPVLPEEIRNDLERVVFHIFRVTSAHRGL